MSKEQPICNHCAGTRLTEVDNPPPLPAGLALVKELKCEDCGRTQADTRHFDLVAALKAAT